MTQRTEDEGTVKVRAKDVVQRAAGKVLVASQQCPGGSSTKTAALESRGLQLAVTGRALQCSPGGSLPAVGRSQQLSGALQPGRLLGWLSTKATGKKRCPVLPLSPANLQPKCPCSQITWCGHLVSPVTMVKRLRDQTQPPLTNCLGAVTRVRHTVCGW